MHLMIALDTIEAEVVALREAEQVEAKAMGCLYSIDRKKDLVLWIESKLDIYVEKVSINDRYISLGFDNDGLNAKTLNILMETTFENPAGHKYHFDAIEATSQTVMEYGYESTRVQLIASFCRV